MFDIDRIWRDISPDPYSLFFLIVISFLIVYIGVMVVEKDSDISFFSAIKNVLAIWFVGVVFAGIVFFIILVIGDLYVYGF